MRGTDLRAGVAEIPFSQIRARKGKGGLASHAPAIHVFQSQMEHLTSLFCIVVCTCVRLCRQRHGTRKLPGILADRD